MTLSLNEARRLRFALTALWSMLLGLIANAQALDYGDFDTARLPAEPWSVIAWNDPGGWGTAIDVTTAGLPANSASTDASAALTTILTNNPGRVRLFFPAGVYYFKTDLIINRGDVWIEGVGDTTEFRLDAPTSDKLNLSFIGSAGSYVDLSSVVNIGDDTISVPSTTGLAAGDLLEVNNEDRSVQVFSSGNYLRVGQLNEVVSTTSNTVTFSEKFGINMTETAPGQAVAYRKLSPVENIRIERIKLRRVRDNLDKSHNLYFQYARNVLLQSITSERSANHHVEVRTSYHFVARENNFSETWDNGVGSHGYGFNFVRNTTRALVEDNDFLRLRHSVVLQQGANHCIVAYNRSPDQNGAGTPNDFITHGRAAHNNLFEGNSSDANIVMDGVFGREFRYNTFFRNDSPEVGDKTSERDRSNVVGNESVSSISCQGEGGSSFNYCGANESSTGIITWGDFTVDGDVPDSLYRAQQPSFVSSWPLYGPSSGGQSSITFEAEDLTASSSGPTLTTLTLSEASGGEWVLLDSSAVGDYVDFTLPNVPAGSYEVTLRYRSYSQRGISELELPVGTSIGNPVDQYAPSSGFGEVVVGSVSFGATGSKTLRLKVQGKNASSSSFKISADRITLVPTSSSCLSGTLSGSQSGAYVFKNKQYGTYLQAISANGQTSLTTGTSAATNWILIDSNSDGEFGIENSGQSARIEANSSFDDVTTSDPVSSIGAEARWLLKDANADGFYGIVNVQYDPNHIAATSSSSVAVLQDPPYGDNELWEICSAN